MVETAVQPTMNAVMQAGINHIIQQLAAQHTTNWASQPASAKANYRHVWYQIDLSFNKRNNDRAYLGVIYKIRKLVALSDPLEATDW